MKPIPTTPNRAVLVKRIFLFATLPLAALCIFAWWDMSPYLRAKDKILNNTNTSEAQEVLRDIQRDFLTLRKCSAHIAAEKENCLLAVAPEIQTTTGAIVFGNETLPYLMKDLSNTALKKAAARVIQVGLAYEPKEQLLNSPLTSFYLAHDQSIILRLIDGRKAPTTDGKRMMLRSQEAVLQKL